MKTLRFNFELYTFAGATIKVNADDVSNSFITNGGIPAIHAEYGTLIAMLVTVEDQAVRIAYSIAAAQTGAAEVGHAYAAGSSVWIKGALNCIDARYINSVGGADSVLQVTPFYAKP